MSKFQELHEQGQSVWFDYIRRDMLTSGELAGLVDEAKKGRQGLLGPALQQIVSTRVNKLLELPIGDGIAIQIDRFDIHETMFQKLWIDGVGHL